MILMKKVLVVDDSALMRRVLCDIINSDGRFTVKDEAVNGLDALEKIQQNQYDAVVLDVNMPKMDGIELLKELKRRKIRSHILMASTDTMDGAQVTLDALELGAMDVIHKPDWSYQCRDAVFKDRFLELLYAVCISKVQEKHEEDDKKTAESLKSIEKILHKESGRIAGNKIVAIACSTGGPKALQSVLPSLPEDIKAPIVLVQHMPVGFTLSFAQRLNSLCRLEVKEAEEGDVLEAGHVYIARGGFHMNLVKNGKETIVHYTEDPYREGVRPSANYMYESLAECGYDEVVCVVMTGMGADGTQGILHLKDKKKIYVITQDSESCVVNGMPKSAVKAGVSNQSVPLPLIAQEIILHVGVK